MGAQSFALAQPAAPTLPVTPRGGTISRVATVYVGVAARTGSGYYYGSGNSQGVSAHVTSMTGSTNAVTATVAVRPGRRRLRLVLLGGRHDLVLLHDHDREHGHHDRHDHQQQRAAVRDGLPGPVHLLEGRRQLGPDLQLRRGQRQSRTPTTTTGSSPPCPGTTTAPASGCSPALAPPTRQSTPPSTARSLTLTGGTVTEIESKLFVPLWNQVKCSPTAIMVNAAQAQEIANLILGASSATTYLNTDASGRMTVTAGGRVGEIINAPAGGVSVPIEVHVSLPPGTIVGQDGPGAVPAGEHLQRAGAALPEGHRPVRLRDQPGGECGWRRPEARKRSEVGVRVYQQGPCGDGRAPERRLA